ncbi:helix-turn-helix domain-containing protein [Muriicola sp. SD30]|uniref:helix-turn-helix domain-containing protein n=1 Tax=Muriicola sp. SD30 TaxID=3240936 RepID=UPI00350F3E0D
MNTIGQIIHESRKSKGLTQEELAELSKVNLRTIQRLENNENEPRGKTLQLICEVLNLEIEKVKSLDSNSKQKELGALIVNGFFLLVLNFVLMGIFGYLTLDSEANLNSRLGGILLSFFLPLFIVLNTKQMNGLERMLKFGSGFILYIILILVLHGFVVGFGSGLFICLTVALSILYYGNKIITT